MLMCSLEPVVISLMLSSVLPLELAQDLFQNTDSVRRLRMCGLLLTVVFSRGEPMPVQYFEQLGPGFANFLLDYIEAPPDSDGDHEVPDVFVGLVSDDEEHAKGNSYNVLTLSGPELQPAVCGHFRQRPRQLPSPKGGSQNMDGKGVEREADILSKVFLLVCT